MSRATTDDLVEWTIDWYQTNQFEDMSDVFTRDEIKEAAINVLEGVGFQEDMFAVNVINTIPLSADEKIITIDEIEKLEKQYVKSQPRLFKVGAPYEGIYSIVEYEDNDIYIPTSYNCAFKIIKKINPNLKVKYGKLNPFGESMRKIRQKCKQWKVICPCFYKMNKKNVKGSFISVSKGQSKGPRIYLLPIDKLNYYHAILVKQNFKKINSTYLYNLIRISKFKDIEIEERKPMSYRVRDVPGGPILVYDFETFTVAEDYKLKSKDKTLKINVQHPYAVGVKQIGDKKTVIFEGVNCHEQILDYITNKYTEPKIYLYAYNGGMFDTLFFKRLADIEVIQEIKSAGRIKKLDITYKKRKTVISLRDSKDYFPGLHFNLALKSFKCELKKSLDIGGKSLEWYKKNRNLWYPYLKQDVDSLEELTIKLMKYIHKFGYDIRQFLTISGMSWDLIMKTCYKMRYTRIPTSISLSMFYREAIFGGRVFVWNRVFKDSKDPLVSLDYNSLYPSVMYKCLFPIGDTFIIENFFDDVLLNYPFIAEVTVRIPNTRYTLFPYRSEKGKLIYPAGVVRGTYTSVEILDLYIDGGEILEFHKGVYWKKTSKIFEPLVDMLYSTRKDLKKDDNPFQSVIKIVLNSFYGKLLQLIRRGVKYSREELDKIKGAKRFNKLKMNNGQFRYDYLKEYPRERKPTYLAAFVLSYARHEMNMIIRRVGKENVYYSDTDSVYIRRSAVKKVNDLLHGDLCGIKNDYGKGKYIDEAIFVGIKRYLLHFNDKNYKAKFNGLVFLKKNEAKHRYNKISNVLSNFITSEDKGEYKLLRKFYGELHKKGKCDLALNQERWRRTNTGVYIFRDKFFYKAGMEDRGEFRDEKFYPVGYDFNKKEYPEKEYRIFDSYIYYKETEVKNNYLLYKGGISSKFPLHGAEDLVLNIPGHDKFKFNTSFVKDSSNGDILMLKKKKNKKNIYENVFYKMNKFGPVSESDEPEDYDVVITRKGEKFPLSDKVNKKTMRLIKLFISIIIKNPEDPALIKLVKKINV